MATGVRKWSHWSRVMVGPKRCSVSATDCYCKYIKDVGFFYIFLFVKCF